MSDVDHLLKEASTPLLKALDGVEAEIEGHEMRLKELREDRQKLTTVLRRIAPEAVPAAPKKEKKDLPDRPAAGVMSTLAEWLRNNAATVNENGGFHVTGLVQNFPPVREIGNQSTISRAMRWLHEDGVVVIDHMGTGGSKYYKVVS
jgi:hypothetical protein